MAYKSSTAKGAGRKTLPGGLRLIDELKDYSLPEVMVKITENRMICHADWPDAVKVEYGEIIRVLGKQPTNLRDYITRQTYYAQLEWAQEILETRKQELPRSVESIEELTGRRFFKIAVDPYFFEQQRVSTGAIVELIPVSKGKIPISRASHSLPHYQFYQFFKRPEEVFQMKAVNIDCIEGSLLLEAIGAKPQLDESYDIYISPTHFNYATRRRTLEIIARNELQDVLFPSKNLQVPPTERYQRREADLLRKMAQSDLRRFNRYQQLAICAMLLGDHGHTPYLLFGPPGTGKTRTLVEAVRLILLDQLQSRILVCTPSNRAADVFACELLKVASISRGDVFRTFSLAKSVSEQDPALRDIVCLVQSGELASFGIPSAEKLRNYRVIICTLATSSYLISGGLRDHFSHIMIDEAGQADELETLTPLVGLAGGSTRVVLAGDPHQLGPVEVCDHLKQFNAGNSLLERFINCESIYTSDDRRFICMLRDNYRSHASIIDIPSKLFYRGQLMASAPADEKSTLCEWHALPKKGFPIIWESVYSEEECEPSGFSYRCVREALIVKSYVDKLLSTHSVLPADIGIITPYRYQAKTLLDMMGYAHYRDICIDSVERYQGSERRIIIVSTVRNTALGFLDCYKRFNTTITRAKELLIVIGNPENLSRSAVWKEFIKYCEANGALVKRPENQLHVIQKRSARLREAESGLSPVDSRASGQRDPNAMEVDDVELATLLGNKMTLGGDTLGGGGDVDEAMDGAMLPSATGEGMGQLDAIIKILRKKRR